MYSYIPSIISDLCVLFLFFDFSFYHLEADEISAWHILKLSTNKFDKMHSVQELLLIIIRISNSISVTKKVVENVITNELTHMCLIWCFLSMQMWYAYALVIHNKNTDFIWFFFVTYLSHNEFMWLHNAGCFYRSR